MQHAVALNTLLRRFLTQFTVSMTIVHSYEADQARHAMYVVRWDEETHHSLLALRRSLSIGVVKSVIAIPL